MPKTRPGRDSTSDSDSGPDDRNVAKKPKPSVPSKSSGRTTSKTAEAGEDSWGLGNNRFVKLSDFKGKWYINIREYYDAGGDMKPTKKGIMLTMEQWQTFKNALPDIDEAIQRHV